LDFILLTVAKRREAYKIEIIGFLAGGYLAASPGTLFKKDLFDCPNKTSSVIQFLEKQIV
jgi:hypothetical protein